MAKRNKMDKGTKTLLGIGAAVAAGAGAYFLLTKDVSASEPDLPSMPPGDPDPEDPDDPVPPKPQEPTEPEPGEQPMRKIERPPGNPGTIFDCSKGEYDEQYWDVGTPEDNRDLVVRVLHGLGYTNFQGKTKSNGRFKRAGAVKRFQEDWNLLSSAGILPLESMGGLAMDGVIGPCTLNAMQSAYFQLDDPSIFKNAARTLRV